MSSVLETLQVKETSKHDVYKWRPLQSFVSVTNNTKPNTSGFEAGPGFYWHFNQWTCHKGQKGSDDVKN